MYPVDQLVERAHAAARASDREKAISLSIAACRQINGYGPAVELLNGIARELFTEAISVRDTGDTDGAIARLVRSVELNPKSGEARSELARVLSLQPHSRDLTTECFIFPDAVRADGFYRHAIQTCVDFVALGGIDGAILEFGVLAGWTARRFAEAMRDSALFADLWLFDSFKGLPRSKHAVDAGSYDVVRGVWQGEMEMPQSIIDEIGADIDQHVKDRLSIIISRERIHIRKGFFSDTLREPLTTKAALVHFDCDLYASTKEIFDALHRDSVLQDGTILMFDDWNCNRGNPRFGQRRALQEFLEAHHGLYAASHFISYGHGSSAFILHTNGGTDGGGD